MLASKTYPTITSSRISFPFFTLTLLPVCTNRGMGSDVGGMSYHRVHTAKKNKKGIGKEEGFIVSSNVARTLALLLTLGGYEEG